MNNEEIQSLIKQLKAAGLNDEEIMDTFYEGFQSGELDRNDLEALAEAMGYELTDDFKKDSQPDPIAAEGAEGATKEDLEAAKEIQPGETKEEFKEKIDETSQADEGADEEQSDEDEVDEEEDAEEEAGEEENDDEEKGWEQAQKMFKI